MKLSSDNLLETLSIPELKNLTLEIKETLVNDYKKVNQTTFTSAELWNIHRTKKTVPPRRTF